MLMAIRSMLAFLAAAVVCATAIAAPGDALGPEVSVNQFTAGDQQLPAVAADAAGNFVVAWDSVGQDGSISGIYARLYDRNGQPRGAEFQVNTYTDDRQTLPAVAMDEDGDFAVVWRSSGQDGEGGGIFAQRFAADGSRRGAEFQVNNLYYDSQSEPQVEMDRAGNFVVLWSSTVVTAQTAALDRRLITVRPFDAQGRPRRQQSNVSLGFLSTLRNTGLGMDDQGNFVVSWRHSNSLGNEIHARRYNAFAFPLDVGSFVVATAPPGGDVARPAVGTSGATGDFVIAWDNFDASGDRLGVRARAYRKNGTASGVEFPVTGGSRVLARPSVAVNADGSFAIAADDEGKQIFVQRYAAGGVAQGAPILANEAQGFYPLKPGLALDGGANPILAWQSFRQDGSGRGIVMRRFAGR